MIIDSHVHVFPTDRGRYRQEPVDGQTLPDIDASAEALIAAIDANGVARAIVVQSAAFARDGRYEREVAARYGNRLTPVAVLPLNPSDADVAESSARLGDGCIRGQRLLLVRGPTLKMALMGAMDGLCERACDLGLPVLILGRGGSALSAVERIAKMFPQLDLVVDHLAYTPRYPDTFPALLALADQPRVRVKIAIHHQLSDEPYPWRDLHKLQLHLLSGFGSDRLMWGSNFPMFMPTPSYQQRLEAMTLEFPFPSEAARRDVMGGTAARLWGLADNGLDQAHTNQTDVASQ